MSVPNKFFRRNTHGKNYSNKEKQQKHGKQHASETDIHHMQMNRTETVKTAEMQIRQHQKLP